MQISFVPLRLCIYIGDMKSLLIGLTGGIGCGKTEVASIFQKLGARVIDADTIGKDVAERNSSVLKKIFAAFGKEFMAPDGRLRRKELGNYVFADDKRKMKLNAIVHPHLLKRMEKEITSAKKEGWKTILVDAALIYEMGLEDRFDKVIVVYSELKHRIARLKKRDGLSDQEILNRIQSQMPLDEKVKRADAVISNDGSLGELRLQTETLFRKFQKSPGSEPAKITLLKKK
jgi:dephospho-CoA kinase